jgi:hypothetical protein
LAASSFQVDLDRADHHIWRCIYEKTEYRNSPWHWTMRPDGNALSDDDWGHCMTLVEAMEHFRMAWDAYNARKVSSASAASQTE